MDQHRQHLTAVVIIAPMLAGPDRAFHHRVDDLQMRRIESEGEVHAAALGLDVGRETLVVFHVARTQVVGMLAFEFGEQVGRQLAETIHQHIQAAAVRHAQHHFLDPFFAGDLDDVVEQWNE